ncbi:MAG: IPT/TIG domain-containing protein [Nitrospinae bacterium]|nr:IPT/TIG domain-containing protein [Nitrospinota bacterium]
MRTPETDPSPVALPLARLLRTSRLLCAFMAAWVLLGVLVVAAHAAPALTLSRNLATFGPGGTLRLALTARNPGPDFNADFYFGVLLPDGVTLLFITSLSPLHGAGTRLDANPNTFQPLLSNIPIPQGFDLPSTDIFVFTFSGSEPPGSYVFFAALTLPGAFSDGRIDPGDILAIDAQSLSFSAKTVDPGITVRQFVRAGDSARLNLPDSARLDIPAGALAADTTVEVTVPTRQTAGSTDMVYKFGPPGTQLNKPATLTIPASGFSDDQLVFVFVSSTLNPLVDVGSELTNWLPATVLSRDEAAGTVTLQLEHFSFWYATIAVDPENRTYLVADLPSKYLQPGDLLFTLNTYGNGPSWQPGHVAAFVGNGGDDTLPQDRIVEADGARVNSSTIAGLKGGGKDIYLGPRRMPGGLTPGQQAAVRDFLLRQRGKGYSLIGEQSLIGPDPSDPSSSYSCVGLAEAALQSVGKGTLNFFDRATVAAPLEQWLASAPIENIAVCPAEEVRIPMYGVVVDHRSAFVFCTYRGFYSRFEPYSITATTRPPGSDLKAGILEGAHGYVFTWTPTPDQAGQTFNLALELQASRVKCTLTGLFDEVSRRHIAFFVKNTPTITGFTPPNGLPGTLVTITGKSLGGNQAVVTFNGAQAFIAPDATDEELRVVVPANATTGPITVTNNGPETDLGCPGTITSRTKFIVGEVSRIKLFDATPAKDTGPVTSEAQAKVYADTPLTISFAPGDTAIISSTPDGTGSIIVDNFITINGVQVCPCFGGIIGGCCVDPATAAGKPLETLLIPIPPVDVSAFIPVGTDIKLVFELKDYGAISGNTELHLVISRAIR